MNLPKGDGHDLQAASGRIEVAGDRWKVEPTRHYFAMLRAGLKTAEETSYDVQRTLVAALDLIDDLIAYSRLREKVGLREDLSEYAEAERLIARSDRLRGDS